MGRGGCWAGAMRTAGKPVWLGQGAGQGQRSRKGTGPGSGEVCEQGRAVADFGVPRKVPVPCMAGDGQCRQSEGGRPVATPVVSAPQGISLDGRQAWRRRARGRGQGEMSSDSARRLLCLLPAPTAPSKEELAASPHLGGTAIHHDPEVLPPLPCPGDRSTEGPVEAQCT